MTWTKAALHGTALAALASAVLTAGACGLDEGGAWQDDGGMDAVSDAVEIDARADVGSTQDAGTDVADANPPFTPATLSGMELWLRADQGLNLDGGTLVWVDQSGKNDPARNASPGTFGTPAVVDAGFGPALFFGQNDGVRTGMWDSGLTDPTSVFIVAGRDPVSTYAYLFDSLDPALRHAVLVETNNLLYPYAGAYGLPAAGAVSKPMVVLAVFNGPSSFILRSANRSDAGSSSPGPNNSTAGFTIGNYAGNGFGFRGYVAEFAAYSRVLSDGELASLNVYAAQRYGVVIQ